MSPGFLFVGRQAPEHPAGGQAPDPPSGRLSIPGPEEFPALGREDFGYCAALDGSRAGS